MNNIGDFMKVVFLDIDGVLNHSLFIGERTPSGVIGIKDELVENLKEIVENTNAKIVLISDWKDLWEKDENKCGKDALYLNKKLKDKELFIYDKTLNDFTKDRGCGVYEYIKNNNVEKFVILDDVDNPDYVKFNLSQNFIKTSKKTGLSKEDIIKAINILN